MQKLTRSFKSFWIKQIPWGENTRAGTLSKLASTSFDHLSKKLLVKFLEERSIDNKQIDTIRKTLDWTRPYLDYL